MQKTNHSNKLILFLICVLPLSVFASDMYGLMMIVKGQVFVINPNGQKNSAKVGMKVNVNDTIETASQSQAKIVMSDRNIINVLADSKLKISHYQNDENGKKVNLSLLNGKVRANVEQKYNDKSNKFEVTTPTAVAGVRGTQFVTEFNSIQKSTTVVTLKGEVSFKNMTTKIDRNKTGSQNSSGSNVESSATTNDVNSTENVELDSTSNSQAVVGVGVNESQTESSNTNEKPVTVVVKKGETSTVGEMDSPKPPIKVNRVELEQIQRDTTVSNTKEGDKPPLNFAPPPPPQSSEIKQVKDVIKRNDNTFGDSSININNKPARVKIVIPK